MIKEARERERNSASEIPTKKEMMDVNLSQSLEELGRKLKERVSESHD